MSKEIAMDDYEEYEGEPEDEDFKKDDPNRITGELDKKARHAFTGRGVTLKMLMLDGVIHAGESLLSLDYLVY